MKNYNPVIIIGAGIAGLCTSFYLTKNNKPHFAEVQSVHEHHDSYYYILIDHFDFRFVTVEHEYCADDEKEFKGIKRK